MSGYCTEGQVKYVLTTQEVDELSKQAGVATTAVITWAIDTASDTLWSYVRGRTEYAALASTMGPTSYNTGTNPYPVLSRQAAQLAADYLRKRMRREKDTTPGEDHPAIRWALAVRRGDADVPAA